MSLADKWNKKLVQKDAAKQAKTAVQFEAEGQVWASQVIAQIPAAIEEAAASGKTQIEIGEFRVEDLPLAKDSKGEYYPTRDQLLGGARILFDYCEREGLLLFVGGDFGMGRGGWTTPFEVIIRLKR